MRIVSIPVINGVPQYQDYGGLDDFGQNEIKGNLCIGKYFGSLTEDQLPTSDFKGLFTATEYRAISNLAQTDDNAFQFWDMAQTSDDIDLDDPRTDAGLNYVSGMGAITPDRLAIIKKGKAV